MLASFQVITHSPALMSHTAYALSSATGSAARLGRSRSHRESDERENEAREGSEGSANWSGHA